MEPIANVAADLGLAPDAIDPYGRGCAKITQLVAGRQPGRLILVSAINPAPAGEGKTTVSIGLAMGLRRLGRRVVLALREPSLGPVFGLKGGATGGGKAVLVPADAINLHFTGDLHAIGAAHNLLAALADNSLHFATPLAAGVQLDARQLTWPRAIDMNDRALRQCVVGLGTKADGVPRQTRFDITAASEVMAILALAADLPDLQERLAKIVVGYCTAGLPVTAAMLEAHTSMAVLLRQALHPNLVQTAEGGPTLVHCGPFANIAHGCNSLIATRQAQQLGDYVVTEAGFGFDLGGEKFLNLKCRTGHLWPRVVVVVLSLRSLKMHGGAPLQEAAQPDAAYLAAGMSHVHKHLESIAAFGLPAVVAINVFPQDTAAELQWVQTTLRDSGVDAACIDAFSQGGAGALELAELVGAVAAASDAAPPVPRFTYAAAAAATTKVRQVAVSVYGADDVVFTPHAQLQLQRFTDLGFGHLPICIAKTPASLTDDPKRRGRPRGFSIRVQEVRLSAGAGFLVVLTGDVNTMPGLPRLPASRHIRLDARGQIVWT